MSQLRVAKAWSQRPTAVLMEDPHFGNRDFFTGAPIRSASDWTEWDFALANAMQLKEDLTNRHGLLEHEVEDPRMFVNAVKKIDKFQAAVDRKTKGTKKKGYEPEPGEYFVPDMQLRYGEWPSIKEYFQRLAEEAEGS